MKYKEKRFGRETFPVSTRLDKQILDGIDAIALERRLTRSQVIEQILLGGIVTSDDLKRKVEQLFGEET